MFQLLAGGNCKSASTGRTADRGMVRHQKGEQG